MYACLLIDVRIDFFWFSRLNEMDNPFGHAASLPLFIPSKIASHCSNAFDCRFGDHRQTARKEIGGFIGSPKNKKMKLQKSRG